MMKRFGFIASSRNGSPATLISGSASPTCSRSSAISRGLCEAYRTVLGIAPTNGEAWWSLANLKTYRFGDEEIAAMNVALSSEGLREDDRLRLHFALGKALEDRGEAEASFDQYRQGNSIRSVQTRYRPAETTALVDQTERLFTPEFLKARKGWGCDVRDPIFIVGMPRAGSTLVEQILASHPLVEGTVSSRTSS